MDLSLQRDLESRGYIQITLVSGFQAYCKFAHLEEGYSAVKIYPEIESASFDNYIFFLNLPQRTRVGRKKLLNHQKTQTEIDALPDWMDREDIDWLCELAHRNKAEAALGKLTKQLEAKLMEGEMEEFDPEN